MTPFFSRAARLPGSLLSSVIDLVGDVIRFFPLLVRSRSALSAEVLFLRKQLAFYEERQVKPRRLNNASRLSLVVWSRLFEWKDALVIVKPETLLRWHRKGFRLFWKWKSRVGRPRLPKDIRDLIVRMALENPTWGSRALGEARDLRFAPYRAQVLASGTGAARPAKSLLAALEDVCSESRAVHRSVRLLGRCDRSIPNTLRVPGYGTRNAAHRALPRDDTPHSRMDPATVSGSHSLRSLLPLSDPRPRFDLLGRSGRAAQGLWAARVAHARASTASECPLRTVGRNCSPRMLGLHDSVQRSTPAENPKGVGPSLQQRAPAPEFGAGDSRARDVGDSSASSRRALLLKRVQTYISTNSWWAPSRIYMGKDGGVKDPMLRRRRPLISSPLEWQMTAAPVPHPVIPVLAERGGTQLHTPRATVLVDTREQNPLNFSRFRGWFAAIEKKALPLGDYSIAGLEDFCVVERKDLSDLVHSCTVERAAFVNRLRLMAQYPHRLLVITSPLSQVKSRYTHSNFDPNRVTQFLVATLAGLQVPFVCSETHELGEELVGSYLYQVHLYHWLESNDYGRFLSDNDI